MSQSVSAVAPCPNCGGEELYGYVKPVASSGGYGPQLLPGLGNWLSSATFRVVVCGGCGLTRFFASPAALENLPLSTKWRRV